MATNVIEILLKFKKEGEEVFKSVADSVAGLKKNLSGIGDDPINAKMFKQLEEELTKAGVEAKQVEKYLQELAALANSPIGGRYAQGVIDGLNAVDKAAVQAFLNLKEVQDAMNKGGDKGAYLVGLADAVGGLGKTAETARAQIGQMNNVNLDAIKNNITGISDALKKTGDEGGKSVSSLTNVFKQVEGGALSFTGAIKGLVGVFAGLAVVKYLKDAVEYSARVEVLGTVLQTVGKTAGYTEQELNKAEKAVKSMGITSEKARESLTQLINSGLNVSFAGPLARAAQDLAVIAGWNSSDTFARLLVNIQQMDTMGLRFMGIMVDRVKAEQQYAASLGKTADALSTVEKREAFANAVLEEAAKRTGVYENSMSNAAKQVQSLDRYKKDLAETIGNQLLPAYSAVVEQFTLFLKEVTGATKEVTKNSEAGKELADVIRLVGAAIRDITGTLIEYKEIVLGVALAYGVLKGALALSAATGAATVIGGLGAAWAAFTATIGTAGTALGLLALKIPVVGAAIGEMIAAFAVGAAPIAAVVAAIGSLYLVWKAFVAYKEKLQAEESLRQFQEKLAKAQKDVPDSYKKMWDDAKKNTDNFTNTQGKSRQEIQAQMENISKIIEAAGARYALAMSKGKKATEEDKQAIRDWHEIVEGKLIPALGRMAAERDKAAPSIEKEASSYEKTAERVRTLVSGYESASQAMEEFFNKIRGLVDVSDKLGKQGMDFNYQREIAELKLLGETGVDVRKRMAEVESNYIRDSEDMVRNSYQVKRGLAAAEWAAKRVFLEEEIEKKKQANDIDAATKLARELTRTEQQEVEQRLQFAQQEHDELIRLRDDAFKRAEEQARELSRIQRAISQETMSYEVERHDLTMRLGEDALRSKEEALKTRERELATQERAAQATGNQAELERIRQAREGIVRDRETITRERESMEKAIKADAQVQFDKYINMAREALAAGHAKEAEEYERIAAKYGQSVETVAGKIKNLDALHEQKINRLREEEKTADAAYKLQISLAQELNGKVDEATSAIKQMVEALASLQYENQLFTLGSRVDSLKGQLESLAKARETAMAKGKDFWTPAQEDAYKKEVKSIQEKIDKTGEAIEKVKGLQKVLEEKKKLNLETEDAKRKLDEARKDVEKFGSSQGKATVTANTDQAHQAMDRLDQRMNNFGSAGKAVQVKVMTNEAQQQVDNLNKVIEELRRRVSENQKLGMDTSVGKAQLALVEDQIKKIKGETRDPVQVQVAADKAVQTMQGLGFSAKEAREAIARPITVDVTDQATGKVERITANLRDLTNSQSNVKVGAQTNEAEQKLQTLVDKSKQLNTSGVVVPVEVRGTAAEQELYKLNKQRLDLETGMVFDIKANGTEALNVTATLQRDLDRLHGTPSVLKITADDTQAKQEINNIDNNVPPIDVPVKADTGKALQELDKINGVAPNVDLNVRVNLDAAMQELDKINGVAPVVQVSATADVSPAMQELDRINAAAPQVTAIVNADTSNAINQVASLGSSAPTIQATVNADTAQAEGAIYSLQAQRIDVRGQVYTDVSQAMSAINSIPRFIETVHRIRTEYYGNTGGLVSEDGILHYSDGGYNKYSGLVSGFGTGVSDSIPAMIANGEYIVRAAAVEHYGVDLLRAINQMVIPRPRGFAEGGIVASAVAGRLPTSIKSQAANDTEKSRDVVDVNFNVGGKSFRVQSARDTAKNLAGALRELSRAG